MRIVLAVIAVRGVRIDALEERGGVAVDDVDGFAVGAEDEGVRAVFAIAAGDLFPHGGGVEGVVAVGVLQPVDAAAFRAFAGNVKRVERPEHAHRVADRHGDFIPCGDLARVVERDAPESAPFRVFGKTAFGNGTLRGNVEPAFLIDGHGHPRAFALTRGTEQLDLEALGDRELIGRRGLAGKRVMNAKSEREQEKGGWKSHGRRRGS